MPDEADDAQAHIEQEAALRHAQQQALKLRFPQSPDGLCFDCEAQLNPFRLSQGFPRCFECQEVWEKQLKRGPR